MAILGGIGVASAIAAACDDGTPTPTPDPSSSLPSTVAPTTPTTRPPTTADTTVPSSATAPPTSDTSAPNAIIQPGFVKWERIDFGSVSAYLVLRDGLAALIDTGPAGGIDRISNALDRAGLDGSAISDIILTHDHPDHAGGLGDVLALAPSAAVSAGVAAAESVDGPMISELRDGEFVFGLQVAASPGHAPGHVSLFEPIEGLLFAGDAVRGADAAGGPAGEIAPPLIDSAGDADLAAASIVYLASLQPSKILCGHGAPIVREASRKLTDLAG